jgi:hypothetical protein
VAESEILATRSAIKKLPSITSMERLLNRMAAMVEEYFGVVQFAGPQGLGNPDGWADSRTTKLCDLLGKK